MHLTFASASSSSFSSTLGSRGLSFVLVVSAEASLGYSFVSTRGTELTTASIFANALVASTWVRLVVSGGSEGDKRGERERVRGIRQKSWVWESTGGVFYSLQIRLGRVQTSLHSH